MRAKLQIVSIKKRISSKKITFQAKIKKKTKKMKKYTGGGLFRLEFLYFCACFSLKSIFYF
jgi:hypothetical protein